MSQPRLAYLVSQYPAVSHTFILREVEGLRRRGFDIETASINRPDRSAEQMTAAEQAAATTTFVVKRQGPLAMTGALVRQFGRHPLRCLGTLGWGLRLAGADLRRALYHLLYFVEAMLVADWMRRRNRDHLHVHFATPAATVAMLASRLSAKPFSMTVHGPDEFYDAPGYLLTEKVAAAAFVCCIGAYARSQLMKLSPPSHWDKLEVAPLGVDPSHFVPLRSSPTEKPFEILCVGRLVAAKGQHVLVAAIERLVRAGLAVRLRLVGDGPDRRHLEAYVRARSLEDNVLFEGAVNQDRIRDLYRCAHAFALASFAEGIPVVLMEAMAMRLPCVATRITGIPELIRDGVDGLLVAPSDDAALAEALRRLILDPHLRIGLGEAGRGRVCEHYHLDHNLDRLGAIFERRTGSALDLTQPRPTAAEGSVAGRCTADVGYERPVAA